MVRVSPGVAPRPVLLLPGLLWLLAARVWPVRRGAPPVFLSPLSPLPSVLLFSSLPPLFPSPPSVSAPFLLLLSPPFSLPFSAPFVFPSFFPSFFSGFLVPFLLPPSPPSFLLFPLSFFFSFPPSLFSPFPFLSPLLFLSPLPLLPPFSSPPSFLPPFLPSLPSLLPLLARGRNSFGPIGAALLVCATLTLGYADSLSVLADCMFLAQWRKIRRTLQPRFPVRLGACFGWLALLVLLWFLR